MGNIGCEDTGTLRGFDRATVRGMLVLEDFVDEVQAAAAVLVGVLPQMLAMRRIRPALGADAAAAVLLRFLKCILC